MLADRSLVAIAALLVGPAAAISGMATTTRYHDGQEGACGCGSSGALFPWQQSIGTNVYTAAGSQALFDAAGSSWCGAGCGQCYELTSTGKAPAGQGMGGQEGQNITVMVTNLCPNAGNAQWCPQPGQDNQYGYQFHFDIMANDQTAPIIGDNSIVNFRSVPCPGQALNDYEQCVCSAQKGGSSGGGGGGGNGGGSGSGPSSSAAPAPAGTSSPGNGGGSSGSGSGSGQAQRWGQCGGKLWTGPTSCAAPYTCQQQNPYYSQCL